METVACVDSPFESAGSCPRMLGPVRGHLAVESAVPQYCYSCSMRSSVLCARRYTEATAELRRQMLDCKPEERVCSMNAGCRIERYRARARRRVGPWPGRVARWY